MKSSALTDEMEEINPLDAIEYYMGVNEMNFERTDDDELRVSLKGRWEEYKMYFIWHSDMSAMQLCMHTSLTAEENIQSQMASFINTINCHTWFGHFELRPDDKSIVFRHTTIIRLADIQSMAEEIEHCVRYTLAECDRFHPALKMATGCGEDLSDNLEMLITEPHGEA